MALFEGEDLVDITVGGRTVKLPRSVAGAMQLPETPQPQQVAPGGPAPAELPGFNPTGVQATPSDQQPAPQGGSSDYPSYQPTIGATPSYAQETPPTAAPQPDFQVAAPQPAKPAAKTPAPKAPTTQQKLDGAVNEQQRQIENQAQAGIDASNIEAAGHAMVGEAYAKRNAELDKLYAKRAEDANADQAAADAKLNEYTTLKDKIANAKVDREVHHPVLAAISLALGAIGQAMTGGDKNVALDVLWKTIDRRVEGQMADIEKMKSVAGMTKEEIANLREKASNRIAMHNMLIAGESDRAAKQVEEMVARTQSDVVRANGMNLAAQLRERGAVAVQTAAQAQLQYDQREKFQKQEMGYKYASLSENKRQFNEDLQFKREKEYLDYNRALAAERAKSGDAGMKAMMELQKDNETRGIRNVNDGSPILTAKGRAMLAEADKLSAEAAGLKVAGAVSPQAATRAQMLEDKASQIRGEANVKEVLRHRDPTQAGASSKLYATTQSIVSLTDDIKNLYDTHGRAYFETVPGQAAIQEKQTALLMALKNAWQLGVLSKQDATLLNQATGGDTTKAWEWGNIAHVLNIPAGTDPEAFKARLDAISSEARDATLLDLNSIGYGGKADDLFIRKHDPGLKKDPSVKAAGEGLADATPGELAADERSKGGARKVVDRVLYRAGQTNEEAAKSAEMGGSARYRGLSEKQGDRFETLIRAYKTGDAKSKARAEQGLEEWALNKREDLSFSTMTNLRDHAPDLYQKMLAKLPAAEDTTKEVKPTPGQQLGAMAGEKQALPSVTGKANVRARLEEADATRKRATDMSNARGAAVDAVLQATDLGALVQTATELGDNAALAEIGRRAAAGDLEAKKALPLVIQGRR